MSAEKSFWSLMLSVLIVAACAQSGGRTGGNARPQAEDDSAQEDENEPAVDENTCEDVALVNGESAASNCEADDDDPAPAQERDAGGSNATAVPSEPDGGAQPSNARDAAAEDAEQERDEEEDAAPDQDEDEDDRDEDEDEDVDEDADEQADEDADQDEDQDEEQEEEAEDRDDDEDEQRVA